MVSRRTLALSVLAAALLLAATGVAALMLRDGDPPRAAPSPRSPMFVEDELVPEHREPSPSPSPSPKPKPKPPSPPAPSLQAYQGLGAWVDVYDYALRDQMNPNAAVSEMSRRGVRTLYLQTSRWKEGNDIVAPGSVGEFIDEASAKGIAVVGWYLPGFGDLDRDVRRSLAVLGFKSPSGKGFSGLALDLETREEVGGDRDAFNAGIAGFSSKLRSTVPPGTVLGAIVVDAKNNERAPERWRGFPWTEIAQQYDIIMPMAYWTVTKKGPEPCAAVEYDTAAYLREVSDKTTALMGRKKSMHFIGGIADCATESEVAGYVSVLPSLGSLGGGLYDLATMISNPKADFFWSSLIKLNT